MSVKEIFGQLNLSAECKKYGVGLWECPQFLFLVMGLIIIFVLSVVNYLLVNNYVDSPEIVAFASLIVTAISLVVSFGIMRGFENLAMANRMKTEFVSIVSHQLRSPLTNLKWSLELLMSGKLGVIEEKQEEYFKVLKENSNRMNELINDLLIVSRMEMQSFFSKKEPFSLAELVQEVIAEFKMFAQSSNIILRLEVSGALPLAIADRSHVKLVVENFIDNAIRYTKGGGEIIMTVRQRSNKIVFEVHDGGVGIPFEDQKFIFQKFFRAKNALAHQTQGSGLGLYIAKTIIEKSGGKIGFNSKENEGSTFWFVLPIT